MSGAVYPLKGQQRSAVSPQDSVWLSASAGTGKTQVLSARVLRLLLEEGTEPSDILCLTFTKAGAAEMSVRVSEVLARWVRLDDTRLGAELGHVGAPATPEVRARARSLFARVLDCPGGGLRIDTIHAFAQWLLGAFPGEAGLLPGTRAMDDRDRALLVDQVLAELLAHADAPTRKAIENLSIRKGPDAVRGWLMRCASALELWQGHAGWQAPMRARVNALLGLASDACEDDLRALCGEDCFDIASLRQALVGYEGWKAASGAEAVVGIGEWLSSTEAARYADLDRLTGALFFKNGNPRLPKNADPAFAAAMERVGQSLDAIREKQVLIALAAFLTPQLEAGRQFALLWEEAKAREGLVDFDDLIRHAAALLSDQAMADWIRYKLDRQFDHILIDEAQDTNEAQWRIIDALTDDFFAGEGARGDRVRTIFTVGDTKQAIFGFQGTSPRNFMAARDRVAARMQGLSDGAAGLRERRNARDLLDLDLDRSFRTNRVVLDFVDKAIEAIGHGNFGLQKAPPAHLGDERDGIVVQWSLVIDGIGEEGDEEGASNWLSRHDRMLADKIARQVRVWMDEGFPLVKGMHRRATPGDVMVLVRKRRELAALIVARLYAHGVPVAGVDRLRLGAPLSVQDLMAALRFAVQPLDDLTLASLLVSPLIGWTQEELLEHGYRPKGRALWHHLRDSEALRVADTVSTLREIMRRADYDSPQALLHWILIGPMDGRRRLVARLGREANDPIDELLNAANLYAGSHVASLAGFIRWFDAGEGELKREAGAARDEVRVMTVHGSKGLQAPIVILADAAIGTDTPDQLSLANVGIDGARGPAVPIPAVSKAERAGVLAEAYEAAAADMMEEHWRLLYVAMTRAEEALFIAGSLGPRQAKKGLAPEDSWYARLEPLFYTEPVEDTIWGARREWGKLAPLPPVAAAPEASKLILPDWVARPAPEEQRPPRPLTPSGVGEATGSEPPLANEHLAAAAQRGTLIHALLERLPHVAQTNREDSAMAWLARQAPALDEAERSEILATSLGVIGEPGFAEVFGPDALAEVPLAATVGGQVIAGTADRLLVTPERVTVLDFKTARYPPTALADIPKSTLKQMAAYVAVLEAIYQDREVRAAVLYTQTPALFALPPETVALYKGRLAEGQESFALPPVD